MKPCATSVSTVFSLRAAAASSGASRARFAVPFSLDALLGQERRGARWAAAALGAALAGSAVAIAAGRREPAQDEADRPAETEAPAAVSP